MPDQDVKIKLKASLGMDAADVSKAMAAIQAQVQAKPGSTTEADTLKYVNQWLQKVMAGSGSYVEQRKKLIASYKEELKLVRELEAEFKKSDHNVLTSTGNAMKDMAAADAREKAREQQVKDARAFTNRLKQEIDIRTAEETQTGAGRGGGAQVGGIAGWALKKAPILGTVAAGIIVGRMLKAKADEWSEMSETLDIGFADLGRRIGKGTNLRGFLEPGKAGHVSEAMKRLGYSGSDLLKMSEAYGIPSDAKTMGRALQAQGGFARAFGFGQNAEEISGIGRRATQLGIAEPDQQPAFWRTMTESVMRGQKAGIDASESMRALLSLTEDVAAHTGIVSRDYLAGLSGIQKAFEGGLSRFFKGERGAEQLKSVLGAFQHPAGVAQERFLQNSMMQQFGGKMPTADDLDLKGNEASIYNAFSDQQKSRYILDKMPEFSTSKNPKLKYMMGQFAQSLAEAAGGDPTKEQLIFEGFTRMQGLKSMNAQLAMKGAAGWSGRGVGPLTNLAQLFDKGGEEAKLALAGQEAPTGVTMLEEKQQLQRESLEGFSSAVSDSTLQLRTFIEQLKEAGARALAEAERRLHGPATAQPQSYIMPMIEQSLALQVSRTRSMGSSRVRQLGTIGV